MFTIPAWTHRNLQKSRERYSLPFRAPAIDRANGELKPVNGQLNLDRDRNVPPDGGSARASHCRESPAMFPWGEWLEGNDE